MTEKCYYDDAYTYTWESEVIEVIPKEDKYLIVLDKTYFYPEGEGSLLIQAQLMILKFPMYLKRTKNLSSSGESTKEKRFYVN